jgi:outer membrane protein TolC
MRFLVSAKRFLTAIAGLAVASAGCSSPLTAQGERDLRRSVLDSVRREVDEARLHPEPRATERGPGIEKLQLKPELIPELERMAGPGSYDRRAFPMDNDLLGQTQSTMPVTLEQAIKSAVKNNLQVQFGRLAPAIAESQVVAAEGAFDWTLFNTFEYDNIDQPSTLTRQGLSISGTPTTEHESVTNSTGLKRNLVTGGQFTFENDLSYVDTTTPGLTTAPNPADTAGLVLRLDQPLLRGFGSDVAMAQVRLNRNAERDQVATLKRDLIRTVTDTETAYWQLVQAQRNLLILQRLYERGIITRDKVIAREILEATPAQIADARSRVERRAADVLRAQNAFRAASDNLKVLINDPQATMGAEVLIVPVDDGVDAPITFSLIDVLTTAIRSRPEVQQATLSIDNTSIRQQVADNGRLPKLDLRLQTHWGGLDRDFGSAYQQVGSRDFIDYIVGLNFEQPLGNRTAEAQYRQRRLERMQATIAYRNTVQQVVLESKRALRDVVTNYSLIQQTRVSRYAAAENLRSFEVEMQLVQGLTVVNLDLEFERQELLSQAEQDEVTALLDYQRALAQLYAAMGTALEHNQIEFKVPDADEALAAGGLNTSSNPVTPLDAPRPVLAPPSPPFKTGKNP